MNTKLTLTVDQKVIERAKSYAKAKGRSLSAIIENYLRAITTEKKPVEESTLLVDSLRGSFNAPEDFDYKKELTEGLSEKYES